tara:strand:- start:708 stop:908 length:201 start_codon:yes stop_codon:yes gene_type:complete
MSNDKPATIADALALANLANEALARFEALLADPEIAGDVVDAAYARYARYADAYDDAIARANAAGE